MRNRRKQTRPARRVENWLIPHVLCQTYHVIICTNYYWLRARGTRAPARAIAGGGGTAGEDEEKRVAGRVLRASQVGEFACLIFFSCCDAM